jgi:hypothetical protein
MQTAQQRPEIASEPRARRVAQRAAAGLLRKAPVRALRWLPVALLRGLLVVASGRLPWLLCALLFAAGCGVARDDAEALLGRGQATAALRQMESDEGGHLHDGRPARARYALVRGLVHLSLADRVAAGWWLTQASEIVIAEPASLDAVDRARLEDALQGLARGP